MRPVHALGDRIISRTSLETSTTTTTSTQDCTCSIDALPSSVYTRLGRPRCAPTIRSLLLPLVFSFSPDRLQSHREQTLP
jgi:hypothetical protein